MRTLTLADTGFIQSRLHPDVVDWQRAIVAAGATISLATLRAANRFVISMEQAGLWAKVYMADLCCGDTLTAALVRLKVPGGVSRSYTNANFVSGDYSESTGLTGNGTSKILNTGINPVSLGYSLSDFGIWVYRRTDESAASASFGSETSGVRNDATYVGLLGGVRRAIIGSVGTAEETKSFTSGNTGLAGATANGSRAVQIYVKGAAVGTSVTTTGGFANSTFRKHGLTNSGAAGSWTAQTLTSCFITSGLSSTQAATLNTLVNTFETALGRNV